MLQWQVDVLAHLLALRHRRQRVVVDGGRIQIQQPDPFESVDDIQGAQQPCERAALVTIDAVERRVLRDQQELLDAARRQRARLTDNRLGPTAPVVAPERWNDAEGTLVVAAFGDLHVGIMFRRREQARGVGVVDVGR